MLARLARRKSLILLVLVFVGAAFLLLPVEDALESPREAEELALVNEPLPSTYSPEKVSFGVRIEDAAVSPYRITSAFVMPGETVTLEAVSTDEAAAANLRAAAGEVTQVEAGRWRWQAPREPGAYPLRITNAETGESILVHAFVKVPFDAASEQLDGYRIGHYESEPYQNNPIYNRPEGFVRVTPENVNLRVSPHFTLGQFVAKQEGGYPKYLALQEALLLKLEVLLEKVNEAGIPASTFHVMSGYRTPFYNRTIGNETSYSAHLYGAAADIFVDMDGDTYMDDLNDDGEVTTEDAGILAELVEDLRDESWYRPLVGGLGIYTPAPHRGPFIHVDVRGQAVRW